MEVIQWANDEGQTLRISREDAEQLVDLLREAYHTGAAKGDRIDVEIVED